MHDRRKLGLAFSQVLAALTVAGCGGSQSGSPVTLTKSAVPSMKSSTLSDSAESDFVARCAQPGVVRCIGFDGSGDFSPGSGGYNGAFGFNSGILPPSGTEDYMRAVPDTSLKSSGASSLRFTIPPPIGVGHVRLIFHQFLR